MTVFIMCLWLVVNAYLTRNIYETVKQQDEELQALRRAFNALIEYTDKERDFVQEALRDARRTVR